MTREHSQIGVADEVPATHTTHFLAALALSSVPAA